MSCVEKIQVQILYCCQKRGVHAMTLFWLLLLCSHHNIEEPLLPACSGGVPALSSLQGGGGRWVSFNSFSFLRNSSQDFTTFSLSWLHPFCVIASRNQACEAKLVKPSSCIASRYCYGKIWGQVIQGKQVVVNPLAENSASCFCLAHLP